MSACLWVHSWPLDLLRNPRIDLVSGQGVVGWRALGCASALPPAPRPASPVAAGLGNWDSSWSLSDGEAASSLF